MVSLVPSEGLYLQITNFIDTLNSSGKIAAGNSNSFCLDENCYIYL